MTKKDYKLIALAVRIPRPVVVTTTSERDNHIITDVARSLANELAYENPKFDRTKFLAACDCFQ